MGPMINQSRLCNEIPVKAVDPEGEHPDGHFLCVLSGG